jgi:5-oxoprolinase (ATP-hydrolysing)
VVQVGTNINIDISPHSIITSKGGQHACAIARNLGMKTIFIHRFAGILSAYGLGLADIVYQKQVRKFLRNSC